MYYRTVFSLFGLIVFTSIFSPQSFSQTKNIVVSEDKYFVDTLNKIILCTERISSLDLDGAVEVNIVFDKSYKLKVVPSYFSYSESYDLEIGDDEHRQFKLFFTQLPVFSINTKSEIVDDPKVGGYLSYSDSTGVLLKSDIGIEMRGHSSLGFPKKTYDLEFWADESGEETVDVKFGNLRSDDDWILDGLYNEPGRINSYTALKLWLDIHKLYYSAKAPKAKAGADCSYAELFLNGQYHGIYLLSEQVDRKQLDLKKTSGTTVEGELIKGDNWGDAVSFIKANPYDKTSQTWDGFEMKYPDEFISWNNIHDFVDFVVNSSDEEFKRNISNKFVINNAIDYFIFMNVLGASDNTGKNIFICKYKSGEPYFYTPWDLDGTYGTIWDGTWQYTSTFVLTNGLYERLFRLNPNQFIEKLVSRWNELSKTQLRDSSLVEGLDKNYNLLKSNNVYEREALVWKEYKFSINDFNFMKSWINARVEFIDGYVSNLNDSIVTSIDNSHILGKVYPIPASDFISIDFKGAEGTEFSIVNLQGVIQRKGKLNAGKNIFETTSFENGIYFLVIDNTVQKISIAK